jgi:hypothetical protein
VRDRTRSYTTDLPRIGLPFLANMRSRLADAEPGTQLYTQTESGTLYTFRQADSYAMTINGVTGNQNHDHTSRVWRAGMVRLSPLYETGCKAVYR